MVEEGPGQAFGEQGGPDYSGGEARKGFAGLEEVGRSGSED